MATPTDQDREKAWKLAIELFYCNAESEGCASIRCTAYGKCMNLQEMHSQALADVREQNQETRLKYCPTHRTIVPAFKDHRLSCCVLADEREATLRMATGHCEKHGEHAKMGMKDDGQYFIQTCMECAGEAAYRAGQENLAAMKTEIQSVYDQVCLIPERPKATQAFINGLARAMVILGMKEPIPHGGDYCDEPPPSEGTTKT